MSRSLVLEYAPERPEEAREGFHAELARATDPSDVHADMEGGVGGFVVVDARSPEAYDRGHVPGAVNLPHRQIDATTTAELSKAMVIVTYCDGIGCNGSTKAALKLSALGFRVKEMLGGLDWWIRDGYAVEAGTAQPQAARASCGC